MLLLNPSNGLLNWTEKFLQGHLFFQPFLAVNGVALQKENEQESPAWTQEAYRPLCSEYSFCCPNWVPLPRAGYPPSVLTWPGGGTLTGYPPAGYSPHPDLARGYPTWVPLPPLDLAGYPPRCLPHGILGKVAKHYGIWGPPPGVCPMAFWEMLQSIMGYGYPPVDRQIDGWKDRCMLKHYLPIVLRTRVVITALWLGQMSSSLERGDQKSYRNGTFTLHGIRTGTGIGNRTGTIGDNGSGSCPCLGPVWTFLYNILGPINPISGPCPVQCE